MVVVLARIVALHIALIIRVDGYGKCSEWLVVQYAYAPAGYSRRFALTYRTRQQTP
jgi:hypothetical protein